MPPKASKKKCNDPILDLSIFCWFSLLLLVVAAEKKEKGDAKDEKKKLGSNATSIGKEEKSKDKEQRESTRGEHGEEKHGGSSGSKSASGEAAKEEPTATADGKGKTKNKRAGMYLTFTVSYHSLFVAETDLRPGDAKVVIVPELEIQVLNDNEGTLDDKHVSPPGENGGIKYDDEWKHNDEGKHGELKHDSSLFDPTDPPEPEETPVPAGASVTDEDPCMSHQSVFEFPLSCLMCISLVACSPELHQAASREATEHGADHHQRRARERAGSYQQS